MAFHPYPQVIPQVFNPGGFGPPRGLTRASTCPWIDHSASGLDHATHHTYMRNALFGLAFATATPHGLTSQHNTNSQAHSSKGTPSPHPKARLRRIVGTWFQVLFHSPPGVLFTFPSRYLSAIGHQGVFRLNGWSRQIRTEFLEFRATWEHNTRSHTLTNTGLSPATAPLSNGLRLHAWFLTTHLTGSPGMVVSHNPHNATPAGYHTP